MTVSSQTRFFIALSFLFIALPAAAQNTLRLQDDVLPNAVVGRAYSHTLQGIGGSSPYTYTLFAGTLPQGLALTGNTIAGNPTAAGAFTPTVRVSDAVGLSAYKILSIESLRIEAHNNWCSISQMGGSFSSVGMFNNFSARNLAIAGSDAGGVFATDDGGTTWTAEKDFGSQPVADVAINECTNGGGFWAMSLPSGVSKGSIYRNVLGGGAMVNEINLPATWTGQRRRIRQAYQDCGGSMLASDHGGGVLFKDSALSGWQTANNGLPPNGTGGFNVLDMDYGYAGNKTFAAVMTNDPGKTFDIYTSGSPSSGWSRCTLITSILSQQWRALAIMPDGLIIIGNAFGATRFISASACPGGSLTVGPQFRDGTVTVTPVINGFAPAPCYGPGNRQVYAYTSDGIFFTRNVDNLPFERFDRGLLSVNVTDLGLASSCGDPRLIAATKGRGVAAGTDAGLCHGQMGADRPVNVNGLAADYRFNTTAACKNGVPPAGLHLSSPGNGLFRDGAYGQEFFAAGDTREKQLTGITTAPRSGGSHIFASSAGGVYRSTNNGVTFPSFNTTDEPLTAIAGAPLSTGGAAYGISANRVFAANSPGVSWSQVAAFPAFNGAAGVDLSPGGPLTGGADDDEMWLADGLGGLFELQYISGVYTLFIQDGASLRNKDVRRVAAQQRRALPNWVFVQTREGNSYSYLRGLKDNSPTSKITFSASGAGLPTDEQANQLVMESDATNSGYIWALFPTRGLYISSNSGGDFAPVSASGLPPGFHPVKLTLSRDFNSSGGRLDVALLVAGHGVYLSADGGKNYCFGPAPVNQAPSNPRAIAASTLDNHKILMASDYGAFYSEDGGATFRSRFINGNPVNALLFHPGDDAALLGNGTGIYRSLNYGLTWSLVSAAGNITDFAQNTVSPAQISATRSAGANLLSGDGGATWTVQTGAADGAAVDYNSSLALGGGKRGGPFAPAGATAPYWMAGSSSGVSWSSTGSTWTLANGVNPDYLLGGVGGNWSSVASLGGTASKVLAGNNTYGLYRTLNGGDTWKKVSGPGSGLESSSQVAAALLTSTTAFGNIDALVGMSGSTTGGVYLSGNGGENWTILNNGFDPNSLNISTLVKTSCGGCPVQYYSGTYGSGVYTRTISVVAPPTITGWCFGAGCNSGSTCVVTPPSGPEAGGQPFKLCGTGFAALATIDFDGVAATGCSFVNSTIYTCTATPPHFAGAAVLRLRNTDTRQGTAAYTYSGAARTSGLTVAKSGNNALLGWICPQASCTAGNPARVYRSQNGAFSLNIEYYPGGASNASNQGNFTNTNALAAGTYTSYFWNVE